MFESLPHDLFDSDVMAEFEEYSNENRLLEQEYSNKKRTLEQEYKRQLFTCPNCKNKTPKTENFCKACGFRNDHVKSKN